MLLAAKMLEMVLFYRLRGSTTIIDAIDTVMLRRLLLTSSLILLDSFPYSSRRFIGRRDSSTFARLSLLSPQCIIGRIDNNKALPVVPSIDSGIMASSTKRRSSTRRSATTGKDAEELEMSKENVQNEEDPVAMPDDEDDSVASGTPKKRAVKKKKSATKKKTAASSSDSPKKRKVKGSSKTEDEPSDVTSESEDEESASSNSSAKKKATKKKRATKKKKNDDESASDSEGSPKKKRKSPAKKKKEPHQRVTERNELPKLWDAKEALDTKGSYSKSSNLSLQQFLPNLFIINLN